MFPRPIRPAAPGCRTDVLPRHVEDAPQDTTDVRSVSDLVLPAYVGMAPNAWKSPGQEVLST